MRPGVDGDPRVGCPKPPLLGEDQRVNHDEFAVSLKEALVEVFN